MTSGGEKASISPQGFLPHVPVTYHVTELSKNETPSEKSIKFHFTQWSQSH